MYCRGQHHQSPTGEPKKSFLLVALGVGQNCPGAFRDALALFVQIKHKKHRQIEANPLVGPRIFWGNKPNPAIIVKTYENEKAPFVLEGHGRKLKIAPLGPNRTGAG